MPRHTSKAHAKYETGTKIVLVAADLTFYGITQLPLFSFVNPFLYRLVPSKRTCPIMSVHTVSKIVLSYRAAKADGRTAIGAHATEMETKPFRQISTPNRKPFSSPCWTPATPEATFRQIPETEILGTYNAAMDEVARNIPRKRQPLPSQLVSWEESSPAQRQFYIEKAVENYMLVRRQDALSRLVFPRWRKGWDSRSRWCVEIFDDHVQKCLNQKHQDANS